MVSNSFLEIFGESSDTFFKDSCHHLYLCLWGWETCLLKNFMDWKGLLGNESTVGNGFRSQSRHLQSIDNCRSVSEE